MGCVLHECLDASVPFGLRRELSRTLSAHGEASGIPLSLPNVAAFHPCPRAAEIRLLKKGTLANMLRNRSKADNFRNEE